MHEEASVAVAAGASLWLQFVERQLAVANIHVWVGQLQLCSSVDNALVESRRAFVNSIGNDDYCFEFGQ